MHINGIQSVEIKATLKGRQEEHGDIQCTDNSPQSDVMSLVCDIKQVCHFRAAA